MKCYFTWSEPSDRLNISHWAIVFKCVEIERLWVCTEVGPQVVVRYGPSASYDIVVPSPKMNQLSERIIKSTMESNNQMEWWISILINVPIRNVLDLFYNFSSAIEDSSWGAHIVTSHRVLLTTAQHHGNDVALKVIIEGNDFRTTVIVHMSYFCGISQICIEELQVVPSAGLASNTPAEAIIAVLDIFLWNFIVDTYEEPIGVLVKDVIVPHVEKSIIHFVLDFTHSSDAVTEIITKWCKPGTGAMAQEVDVTIEVIAVAPLGAFIHQYTLKLAIGIIFIWISCDVAIHTNPYFANNNTTYVVVHCHPIGNQFEDFILYLHYLPISIEYLGVLHGMSSDDLVKAVVYNTELSKLLNASRYVHIMVKTNGKRGLIDRGLHTGHMKTVITVVKAGIHQALLTASEDLTFNQTIVMRKIFLKLFFFRNTLWVILEQRHNLLFYFWRI